MKKINISTPNWNQLYTQKNALLEIRDILNEDFVEEIDGIVNLIDHIQDSAVEQGIPEEEIFRKCPHDNVEFWDGLYCTDCGKKL